MERHYGMDWLRIGAFALLILYHIGMFFVPWEWHVKTARPLEWVQLPMLATNAWRLALLFLVSGFASRVLLARTEGAWRFAVSRTARLLVPLLFAVVVIVPPQPWIELMVKHGYAAGFGQFWLHDYFRFGTLDGIILPTWQHLWFVAYLWVYTLALALAAATVRTPLVQRAFDRLFGGWGLLLVPLAWLMLVRLVLVPGVVETHDLVDDPAAHLVYLPALLFGFGLARSEPAFAAIQRFWKPAALLAVLSFVIVAACVTLFAMHAAPESLLSSIGRPARVVQTWTSIVALIGIADRFWNRDHALRPMLTEAVFPFYIIHQTIIVVTGWWLLRFALPPLAEFAVLLPVTVAGCWLFYLAGREIPLLRPLIGLRRRVAKRASSAREAMPT